MSSKAIAGIFWLAPLVLGVGAGVAPLDAASTRADFLQLIDRARVPLASEERELSQTNGLVRILFTFAADAEQRVSGILVKRSSVTGQRPLVIALHGTGGTKESQLPLLTRLADLDFIGVALGGNPNPFGGHCTPASSFGNCVGSVG